MSFILFLRGGNFEDWNLLGTEIVHQKVCLGAHCMPYVVPHNILTHVSNKGYFNNPLYFIVLFSSFYFEFSESWCIGLSEVSGTAKKLVIA